MALSPVFGRSSTARIPRCISKWRPKTRSPISSREASMPVSAWGRACSATLSPSALRPTCAPQSWARPARRPDDAARSARARLHRLPAGGERRPLPVGIRAWCREAQCHGRRAAHARRTGPNGGGRTRRFGPCLCDRAACRESPRSWPLGARARRLVRTIPRLFSLLPDPPPDAGRASCFDRFPSGWRLTSVPDTYPEPLALAAYSAGW